MEQESTEEVIKEFKLSIEQLPNFLLENAMTWDENFIQWSQKTVSTFIEFGDESQPGQENYNLGATKQKIHFEFMPILKGFALLLRDTALNTTNSKFLYKQNKISEEQWKAYLSKAHNVVESARLELLEEYKSINVESELDEKKRRGWSFQSLPWPRYKEQFKRVSEQINFIQKAGDEMNRHSTVMRKIEDVFVKSVNSAREGVQGLEKNIVVWINEIEVGEQQGELTASLVKKIFDKVAIPELYLEDIEVELAQHYEELSDETQIPLDVEGGHIVLRNLRLRNQVQSWLETELMPVMMDIIGVAKNLADGLRLAVMNVKNKPLLMSKGTEEGSQPTPMTALDLISPLMQVKEEIARRSPSMERNIQFLEERLRSEFDLTITLDESKEFLPVSLGQAVRSMTYNRAKYTSSVVQRIKRFWKSLVSDRLFSEYKPIANIGARIVDFIESRKSDSQNPYVGLFTNRGFLGESFIVGREYELNYAAKMLEDWNQGYRGSFLLTGTRFSGKTSVFEKIILDYIKNDVIRLHPNREIKIKGRKIAPSVSLEDHLNAVAKYYGTERVVIAIDDFSSWNSLEVGLAENADSLIRFMNRYSPKYFFLVSMSNCLKQHLNAMMSLSNYFQAEINLDTMPEEDIHEALIRRHGATHKAIFSKTDGKELSASEIHALMRRTIRFGRRNVGESFHLWASLMEDKDDVSVYINQEREFLSFPIFGTDELLVVIKQVFLQDETNERILRKQFGPSWKDRWLPVLQRLISSGVVQRTKTGDLKVNSYVVNELGYHLYNNYQFAYVKSNVEK